MLTIITRPTWCVGWWLMLLMLLLPAAACTGGGGGPAAERASSADADMTRPGGWRAHRVAISFRFERQATKASNQFAIWVTDRNGVHIRTLHATGWTAQGGWKIWPVLLPAWKRAARPQSLAPESLDAVSAATPKTGMLTYTWDCTDDQGMPVPAGTYRVLLEGNLLWDNRVVYSGDVQVGGGPRPAKIHTEFFSDDIDERAMITAVEVRYRP